MNKLNFTDKEHIDFAYWERNQLIKFLTKVFPTHIEIHPKEDKNWPKNLKHIIIINSPNGQLSWHISDEDISEFSHLENRNTNSWDGHSTEEKYKKLKNISKEDIKTLLFN